MEGLGVPPMLRLRATPGDARRLPNDPGHPSARVLSHGSMEVRWFAPRGYDPQITPHDRDEVYVVVSGTGYFMRANEAQPFNGSSLCLLGEERVQFQPGDVLLVPAGAVHRFEAFTDDFAAWSMFYGPQGGERLATGKK